MNNTSKRLVAAAVAGMLMFTVGCSNKNQGQDTKGNKNSVVEKSEEPEFSREINIMALGTFINLKALDGTEDNVKKALELSVDRIKEIENLVSVNIKGTEIENINSKGSGEFQVSEDTYKLIDKSIYYGDLTQGAFDISIYPPVKLWGIGTEEAAVPSKEELNKALEKVDYNKISVADKNKIKVQENTGIDLGAIAKGYIADEVKKIFLNNGITSGFLNFGGNVLVIGEKTNGDPWKIGVRDPFSDNGDYFGILSIKDKTVVTSGNYERYFEEDGVRYHHILSPKDGYPVENGLASVSIIAEKSIDADALSTSAFILGVEDGLKLLESTAGVEGIFVTKNKEVYITSGIGEDFRIKDASFKISQLEPKGKQTEETEAQKKEIEDKVVEQSDESLEKTPEEKKEPKPKVKEVPKVKIVEEADEETSATYD